jgi:hypothetical protein
VFEYRHVGTLIDAGAMTEPLLPEGRPLSYLRVGGTADRSQGLTRAVRTIR